MSSAYPRWTPRRWDVRWAPWSNTPRTPTPCGRRAFRCWSTPMPDDLPDLPDLPELAAAFAAALGNAGVPVGADRAARLAGAVAVLAPSTIRELRHCALATLVSDPDHVPAFDAVFRAVFEVPADPASGRGQA